MAKKNKNVNVEDIVTDDEIFTENNIVKKSVNNIPIILIGIATVVAMGLLTYFASVSVLHKINLNADTAYAESYNKYKTLIESQRNAAKRRAEEASKNTSGIRTIAGYSSDDLVEIDGEWYIVSALVNAYEGGGNSIPILVDPENTIMIGGNEYMHIENPEDIDDSVANNVPFYGSEYVVVDIDGNMVYLVKKGDTLSDVSGRVGYSVQELAAFNSVDNVNLIYEGQTLRIPAPQEAIDYVASKQNSNSDNKGITKTPDVASVSGDDAESSVLDDVKDTSLDANANVEPESETKVDSSSKKVKEETDSVDIPDDKSDAVDKPDEESDASENSHKDSALGIKR